MLIFILRPINSSAPTIVYGEGIYIPMPENCAKESEEKLLALESPTPNVTVEHRLVEGEPVQAILDAARDSDCDLILVGTHGRSGIKHLLMGSVAEKIVRKATCPVMTVKAPRAKKTAPAARPLTLSAT
jgi:nucleotide-binding universal stress UspA family protein